MLLLLQLLLLLLLLQFVLLLLLRPLRRLLLASLDVGLVLLGFALFLRKALSPLGTFLCILCRLAARVVELALKISLFPVVSRLILGPLRRLSVAAGLIERVLALLLLERLGIAGIGGLTLRRLGRIARRLDRFARVALLSTGRASRVVE